MKHLLTLILFAGFAPAVTAEPAKQPNVVLILADDMGRADCGFMGGTDMDCRSTNTRCRRG